ncbi:uncharacterized protein ACWYII_017030 isoform 2-T2 [Salvelinus alpinus]
MSQLQFLNVFLTERLTAVAMEISVVLEQNLGEYQEEISRSNEENKRLQNLLDLVFSSEIKLHREDSQQLSLPVSEEEVPPEQQHCEQVSSPSQRQEDPEPTQIKEEQEELRTSQEEEQPQGLEPDTKDLLIPACVKSDYEQDPPLPSHLDQTLENRERDSLPTNTTEQIKTEPDGEDYRGSEPTRDSQLLSEAQVENIDERVDGMERHIPPPFSPDSQQPSLSVSKEEVPPEQQERSPRLGLEDPEPTKQEELWTNQEEQQRESDSRVSEPTSDSQLLSAVNPDCSAALGENRVCVDGAVEMLVLLFFPPDSQQLSLPVSEEEVPPEQQHCEQERSPSQRQEDPEPTLIKEEQEELRTNQEEDQPQGLESEIRVSEPTSLCRVLEPTILCKVLESTSVANPDCSAAQSEKIEEYVDGLERPILPSYPPELPVFEEEVPPEQQERSPCLQQEDPEPTKVKDKWEEFRTRQEEEQLHIGLSESTSLCRVSEPTLSVANTDCSEAQVENIDERVDGMERHIPPPFSPDSQQPSLSVSKEEVPPEQQERIPRLGLEDPEPTKQEELWTIQEEQQLESDSRVSEPTSDSQLLSAVNPDCSAAQSENGEVHQSPSTSSEQDSSNVESHEASHFSTWSEENISATDSNSSDRSSCTKEDSEARKPAKRTCHSSGVVNEPSDLSNLCDENNPGTEIRPSDGNKDMNIQTDSGAHNPAKRICRRVPDMSEGAVARRGSGEMASCSRPKVPGSTPDYTHCLHCQGPQPTPVTQAPCQPTPVTQAPCQPTPVAQAPCQPTPVAQAPCQPTPVTQAPCQPTPVTQAPCQPTPVTQAPCQPTPVTQAPCQPTPVTQAPCQPTPVTQAPCQPTPVTQAPCQPTPVTQAPCQPTRRTRTQPTPVALAPGQPTKRRTRTQPTRRTRTQTTRRTRTQTTRHTQPTRRTRTQPTPVALAPGQPTKRLQSDSQLLSAVNPECSAAQSENGEVHQSPSTSSEQVSSNVESHEASHFSTWSEENISATDSNSSDRSSCTKEDSEARKPAKRTCHSSGVVNEPSDLSNLCDENNLGTEIRPSDGNKDMNIQTDSGAHNPAKRICRRVPDMSEGAVARRGSGEMASCSRPKVPGSTPDYTHCLHCQGLYIQKSLWKHVRYCPLNPKAEEPKPGQNMRIQSAMVFKLCPQPDYVSTGLWKIVCGMNSGQVSFVVRNDKCILLMGEEMYNKLPPDDRRHKYIQQRMREVARLLITARTCTPLMCFEDLVIPSNLPHVITAVRAVAGYNEENKTYDCPTLAVQMGYNLMNIGSAVESSALTSGQHKVAESAGKFKSFKWNEVVLAGALSTLSEPKNKCPQPTPVTQAPCQPTPVTQAPCQPTPVTQAPCQPTPVTQAPCQPTPVTQAPCQPTPVTQAPCQPTPVTQAPCQPTPVTQAPCQPTAVTQAPCQPTPVAQAPCQPTPVAQAPCQPTPVAQAPGQPIRRTHTQPTRRTRTQPTRRTRTQPTRRTRTQPTRRTRTQLTPVALAPGQPTHRTGTQPTRRTGTQPTRRTGTQPTRRTGTQPTRRTGTQPTRKNTVRLKGITDEVSAVEKHMMPFIKTSRVPEKRDGLKCLQSEPVALKSRNWSGIKFYVNRVKRRQSTAGRSGGSSPDRDSTSGPETGNPTP